MPGFAGDVDAHRRRGGSMPDLPREGAPHGDDRG
jgi:hypothetical protein